MCKQDLSTNMNQKRVTKMEGRGHVKTLALIKSFMKCMVVFIPDLSSNPGCSYVLPEGKLPSDIKVMRAAHKSPLST